MTRVVYVLSNGKEVKTLPQAMKSGLEFTKVYIEQSPWDTEERRIYESDDPHYGRFRATLG